jgi:hypothetical protein
MAEYVTFAPPEFVPPTPCPRCWADLPALDDDGNCTCRVCEFAYHDSNHAARPIDNPGHVCGLDLGKLQDPSAFVGFRLSQDHPPHYRCKAIERWDKGTSYVKVRKHVARWLNQAPFSDAPLVVDATGVGVAVVDEMREDESIADRIVAVVSTGGLAISWNREEKAWHVSKRRVASIIQAILGNGRLTVPEDDGVPGWKQKAAIFQEELKSFTIDNTAAPDSRVIESHSDHGHSDIAMAAGGCFWWCEHRQKVQVVTLGENEQRIEAPYGFGGDQIVEGMRRRHFPHGRIG